MSHPLFCLNQPCHPTRRVEPASRCCLHVGTPSLSACVGLIVGDIVGVTEGTIVGLVEGDAEGLRVGETVGGAFFIPAAPTIEHRYSHNQSARRSVAEWVGMWAGVWATSSVLEWATSSVICWVKVWAKLLVIE